MQNKSKAIASIVGCMSRCGCSRSPGIGLAIVRIGVGLVFLLAGISKLLSLPMTVFMFSQIGLAAAWVYVVSIIEIIGGALLVLGLWTSFAAIPLGIIMLVATVIQFRFGGGLMGAIAPLMVMLVQIQLYLSDSTTWSLQAKITGCSCGECAGCMSSDMKNSKNKKAEQCVCSDGLEDCSCTDECMDCQCASQK